MAEVAQQLERQLLDLKKQIEEAKIRKAEAEGAIKVQRQQLADEHGCKTVKAALKKLDEMDVQIEELNQQIVEGMAKLEKDYDV